MQKLLPVIGAVNDTAERTCLKVAWNQTISIFRATFKFVRVLSLSTPFGRAALKVLTSAKSYWSHLVVGFRGRRVSPISRQYLFGLEMLSCDDTWLVEFRIKRELITSKNLCVFFIPQYYVRVTASTNSCLQCYRLVSPEKKGVTSTSIKEIYLQI